jgi:hypothetical protein
MTLIGETDLPVADRERAWSGAAARNRVFELCGDDVECLSRAFLWRDPDADPTTRAAYSLGFADVIDGRLQIVPRGVAATAGGRGVGAAAIPEDDKQAVQARICRLYARVQTSIEDWPDCPFEDTMTTVATFDDADEVMAVTRGRIRHVAIVDTAAFADARIGLVATAVVAAVGDYADPGFGRTGVDDARLVEQQPEGVNETVTWGCPLTVTDDGRIFGHAALWGRCHGGFRDRCVPPPRDGNGYSRFLHGNAEGVPTGPITVGTTHASLTLDAQASMDHYAHTGRAVADVAIGDDHLGIWVAGRIRPGTTDADIATLRGSSLSADWRLVNGRYRLIGLLAVNGPGYLVERQAVAAAITAGPCDCDPTEARLAAVERTIADILADV